jgi:hypothetical protein
MRELEPKLYDTVGFSGHGHREYNGVCSNSEKNSKTVDEPGGLKKYVGAASFISGLFFSGAGYSVGATGSMAKDISAGILSELPQIHSYLSNGLDYGAFQHLYGFLGESLARANYYGGVGAAIGFLGGLLLMVKFKVTASSFGDHILSVFKK